MSTLMLSAKLDRSDSGTPWGFRMHGGKDFGCPLTIQRVTPGSLAAKCGLQVGDIILRIGEFPVESLVHKEAQSKIIQSTNFLELTLQRRASFIPDAQFEDAVTQGSLKSAPGADHLSPSRSSSRPYSPSPLATGQPAFQSPSGVQSPAQDYNRAAQPFSPQSNNNYNNPANMYTNGNSLAPKTSQLTIGGPSSGSDASLLHGLTSVDVAPPVESNNNPQLPCDITLNDPTPKPILTQLNLTNTTSENDNAVKESIEALKNGNGFSEKGPVRLSRETGRRRSPTSPTSPNGKFMHRKITPIPKMQTRKIAMRKFSASGFAEEEEEQKSPKSYAQSNTFKLLQQTLERGEDPPNIAAIRRNSVPVKLPSTPKYLEEKPRNKPLPKTGFIPKQSQYNSPLALYGEYEGVSLAAPPDEKQDLNEEFGKDMHSSTKMDSFPEDNGENGVSVGNPPRTSLLSLSPAASPSPTSPSSSSSLFSIPSSLSSALKPRGPRLFGVKPESNSAPQYRKISAPNLKVQPVQDHKSSTRNNDQIRSFQESGQSVPDLISSTEDVKQSDTGSYKQVPRTDTSSLLASLTSSKQKLLNSNESNTEMCSNSAKQTNILHSLKTSADPMDHSNPKAVSSGAHGSIGNDNRGRSASTKWLMGGLGGATEDMNDTNTGAGKVAVMDSNEIQYAAVKVFNGKPPGAPTIPNSARLAARPVSPAARAPSPRGVPSAPRGAPSGVWQPNIPSGPRKMKSFLPGAAKNMPGVSSGVKVPICDHCGIAIRGPFVLALDKSWCPDHFNCSNPHCKVPLLGIGFVEEAGQLFCEQDYEKYFAPRCGKCAAAILRECVNALKDTFHPECFLCFHCNKPIGSGGFHVEEGKNYCEKDWQAMFQTKCYGCEFPIEPGDRWVEALDQNWHSECFNCSSCQENLEGKGFYAKQGKPFCKKHAYKFN